jgi:hypothetical protein
MRFVIVDHADSLHPGMDSYRSDELEAAALQFLRGTLELGLLVTWTSIPSSICLPPASGQTKFEKSSSRSTRHPFRRSAQDLWLEALEACERHLACREWFARKARPGSRQSQVSHCSRPSRIIVLIPRHDF